MNPDNSINMEKLLLDFQQYFRENADSWIERFDYKESGPQLLLQASLPLAVEGRSFTFMDAIHFIFVVWIVFLPLSLS